MKSRSVQNDNYAKLNDIYLPLCELQGSWRLAVQKRLLSWRMLALVLRTISFFLSLIIKKMLRGLD